MLLMQVLFRVFDLQKWSGNPVLQSSLQMQEKFQIQLTMKCFYLSLYLSVYLPTEKIISVEQRGFIEIERSYQTADMTSLHVVFPAEIGIGCSLTWILCRNPAAEMFVSRTVDMRRSVATHQNRRVICLSSVFSRLRKPQAFGSI